jgi:hypothetical protein
MIATPPEKPSRRRRLLKKLLLFVVSLVFALGLAEIGLRIYVAVTDAEIAEIETAFVEGPGKLHAFDPEIGWVLKPDYDRDDVVTNSLGFRMTTEPAPESGRGKQNVLLLGDSMLFGIRIEQQFVLSELLNKSSRMLTYVNTGAVGYNNAQELMLLRRHIDALDPVCVVLFYTQSNDPWWNARSGRTSASYALEDDTLVAQPPVKSWRLPLYKRSTIYRFLSAKGLSGKDFTYLRQRLDWMVRKDDSYDWQVTKRILQELAAECASRDVPFVVVDLATRRQVLQLDEDRTRQRLLREFAAAAGIPYVDMLDEYPPDPEPLFFRHDSHWNRSGHRFVADVLKRIVREQLDGR